MELTDLTIDSTRTAIADGKTSATALAGDFYAKIESDDPKIGAYLILSKEPTPLVRSCVAAAPRSARFSTPGMRMLAGMNLIYLGGFGSAGAIRRVAPITRLRHSVIRMAMVGCFRKSRRAFLAGSIRLRQHSRQRAIWQRRCGGRKPRTAKRSTERGPWISPANERLSGVVALSPAILRDSRRRLQDSQVNLIRQEPAGFGRIMRRLTPDLK